MKANSLLMDALLSAMLLVLEMCPWVMDLGVAVVTAAQFLTPGRYNSGTVS
jgi:hypothetical protein